MGIGTVTLFEMYLNKMDSRKYNEESKLVKGIVLTNEKPH